MQLEGSTSPVDAALLLHVTLDAGLASDVKEPAARTAGGEWTFHVRERCHVHGSRTLRLPRGVDAGKVTARVHDGVLQVVCPKLVPGALPQAERTRIPVL